MTNLNLWIVVSVKSGIPVEIKHFYDEKVAYEYRKQINLEANEEEDSIEIFAISINKSKLR